MYLTKTFINNFLYGGLLMGVLLTIIDIIKESNKNIAFYAFLSGSFIIINLIQYYYIDKGNNNNTYAFLIHSIIGGIVWVIYSIILYYLYTLKVNKYINILIVAVITIVTTFIYYMLLMNNNFKMFL